MEETDVNNEKLSLLDRISDHCLICAKPFNKYSWKMAMVWHVIILEQERVKLYCPDCWDDAMKLTMLQYDVEE